MPGPAPSDNARRRNKRAKTLLPAEGRKGRAPAFPIKGGRVPAVWAELWKTPQAAEWERLGWTRTIARYALLVAESEKSGAPMSVFAEIRQLEDRLGLTPMSMLRLGWETASDEVSEKRTATETKAAAKGTAERRRALKIVG